MGPNRRVVRCCAGQLEGWRGTTSSRASPCRTPSSNHSTASCATSALTSTCSAALGKRARSSRRGGTTTTTCAHTRVSATWRRRSSRQGIKGARPSRAPLGQQSWPARCKARRPRIQNQTVFQPPSESEGWRKNWDKHETKTTNDTPQEGRNNRRTLLITGGKLGCRPLSNEQWFRRHPKLRMASSVHESPLSEAVYTLSTRTSKSHSCDIAFS